MLDCLGTCCSREGGALWRGDGGRVGSGPRESGSACERAHLRLRVPFRPRRIGTRRRPAFCAGV